MNNNNRRGPQNRQQNRSRNRHPSNRYTSQGNRTDQNQRSQQCNPPDTDRGQNLQATSQASTSSTTSGLSQQHWHQSSPYSKTYSNPNQSQSPVENYGYSSQQLHREPQNVATNRQAAVEAGTPTSGFQYTYVPGTSDVQADALYSDVHGSLMRAINSTYAMPISEHVFYSSYESYDNIMIAQRRQLDEMMSQLSETSQMPLMPQFFAQNAPLSIAENSTRRIDFNDLRDMHDKYDSVQEFSELMYDRIGQNLDDAAGLRMKDRQMVQATLKAANQNKLTATKSQLSHTLHSTSDHHSQQPVQKNLSSSSSSSSLITRPSETGSPVLVTSNWQQQQPSDSVSATDKQTPYRYPMRPPKYNPKGQPTQNVTNPSIPQHQYQQRSNIGYMGKQQYGSQRFFAFARENKNIPRPQDSFIDEIDNSYRPFEPPIKEKPNALVPLSLDLEQDEHGSEFYVHPYEYEIRNFEISEENLQIRDPIEPIEFDSTPVVLVETIEQLEDMCRSIESENEIAVDVEHHSYRSYQGITCLLQISTRTQDFVVDTIKLRNHLHKLNTSFTNPNIVKVFHGADCDVLWLQRDFGVYVVNLFDTSRAAKMVKFAHLSLAFLMKHYCNFETDKSYQLADWRERPLPLPMIRYAMADTHFLLYIYDRLRNDILTRDKQDPLVGVNLLKSVFNRCKEICLKRYEKPPYTDKSHLSVLRRSKTTFNARQMYAFKEMYLWRDKISRKLDESVGYVLPNNLMIRIAEYLPREPQGITALCNPVPPTLKKYLNDIHQIILKAIEVPLEETSKYANSRNPLNVDPSLRSIDLDSVNHKQDVAHAAGLHEGEVHGILDMLYQLNCDDSSATRQSSGYGQSQHYGYEQTDLNYASYMDNLNQSSSRLYNFLDSSPNGKHHTEFRKAHESIQRQFVSPYSRYEARNK